MGLLKGFGGMLMRGVLGQNLSPPPEPQQPVEAAPQDTGPGYLPQPEQANPQQSVPESNYLPEQQQQPEALPQQPKVQAASLGHISARYESGGKAAGTVSSGRNDPGGASYGSHQLSSRAGIVQDFIKKSPYKDYFNGLKPGTKSFNDKWKKLANDDPEFGNEQARYVTEKHFKPIRRYADRIGIPSTPAIDEALFSMGVQHGRYKRIIDRADVAGLGEREIINRLYQARGKYVQSLKSLNSRMKKSILNRYRKERQDVLKLVGAENA